MAVIATKIQKITSKGQITVPIGWRRKIGTDTIVVTTKEKSIEITPARLAPARGDKSEYTVFDALRDNKGKGLKAKDLVKLLGGIDRGA